MLVGTCETFSTYVVINLTVDTAFLTLSSFSCKIETWNCVPMHPKITGKPMLSVKTEEQAVN